MKWQKGQSGNPGGRPSGAKRFAALIRAAIETGDSNVLLARALELAQQNDDQKVAVAALRFLAEYAYGKAPQEVMVNDLRDTSTDKLLEQLPAALKVLKGGKR